MILARWFGRRLEAETTLSVYRRIVAQSRRPVFYAGLGVPDTAEGRFEMLALHLFLVLHRLKNERGDPACAALAQSLVDQAVADLDANLREMGAGDLGVGRKVKRMAKALYGRIGAYEAGLAGGEAALHAAVRQTVFTAGSPGEPQVAALARYLTACRDLLAAWPTRELTAGNLAFPLPESARMPDG
jgi:cytochrome b pre-mRNA-processing protein 3